MTEPIASSAKMYGRLLEGAHIAGYSFERACTHLEWLLVDERWKLDGLFDEVNKFMLSIKLDEFRPIAEQRKRIAQRIKALQPAVSNRTIAKVVGVDHQTINNDFNGESSPRRDGEPKPNRHAREGAGENSPPRTADLSGAAAAQRLKQLAATRGTLGTGENEWYTPSDWLDRARTVLGRIDLDPASSPLAQRTVKAKQFYTVDDDGLTKAWHGRVWMNPPYAQPAIGNFADKLAAEVEADHVKAAIALTHNYTDTQWFHRLASRASAICFPEGRIRFVAPDGTLASPTQGQALFYFGNALDLFRATFGDAGVVLQCR